MVAVLWVKQASFARCLAQAFLKKTRIHDPALNKYRMRCSLRTDVLTTLSLRAPFLFTCVVLAPHIWNVEQKVRRVVSSKAREASMFMTFGAVASKRMTGSGSATPETGCLLCLALLCFKFLSCLVGWWLPAWQVYGLKLLRKQVAGLSQGLVGPVLGWGLDCALMQGPAVAWCGMGAGQSEGSFKQSATKSCRFYLIHLQHQPQLQQTPLSSGQLTSPGFGGAFSARPPTDS